MVRGFGGPQMYYAIERIMQKVANELDMDPLDVIRKTSFPQVYSLIALQQVPYWILETTRLQLKKRLKKVPLMT